MPGGDGRLAWVAHVVPLVCRLDQAPAVVRRRAPQVYRLRDATTRGRIATWRSENPSDASQRRVRLRFGQLTRDHDAAQRDRNFRALFSGAPLAVRIDWRESLGTGRVEKAGMGLVPTGKFRVDERELQEVVIPDELTEHVKCFGIVVDLLVTVDGLVIDGLKRLIVAQQLKIPRIRSIVLPVKASDSWEATVEVLLRQRIADLSTAIRAALGARLLPSAQRAAPERMRDGGARGGRAKRRDPARGGEPSSSPPLGARGGRAAEEVARRVDISRKTLERFDLVRRVDPYLTQEVLSDRISIAEAHRRLREPTSEPEDATGEIASVSGEVEAVSLERFVEELRRAIGLLKRPQLIADPLTEDELYALALLGLRKGNKGIACELGRPLKTMEKILGRAYQKLGVDGRTNAIRLLFELRELPR